MDATTGSAWGLGNSRPAPPPRYTIVRERSDRRPLVATLLVLVWVDSLTFTWFVLRRTAPGLSELAVQLDATRAQSNHWRKRAEQLEQREVTLVRSDQISRVANKLLQHELAKRQEEISELRSDVAFYERLRDPTVQAKGLRVHSARFSPESDGAWRYRIVLTQGLNKRAMSRGNLRFIVEGVRDAKRQLSAGTTCTSGAICPANAIRSATFSSWKES
jgi:hypothetical protein